MTDYYKILNLKYGASDAEIKKMFRKLAAIHHPDKNAGSKVAEEKFKIILNAYQILSDSDKRIAYDIKFKQQFQFTESEINNKNRANSNNQQYKNQSENQSKQNSTTSSNYEYWWVFAIFVILFLYYSNRNTLNDNDPSTEENVTNVKGNSTNNKKIDKQQKPENRPESGELDFKK